MYRLEQYQLKDNISSWKLQATGNRLIDATTIPELAHVLNVTINHLKHLLKHKHYIQFFVPKSNGERRLIETPPKELKKILEKLNKLFQAAYHPVLPKSSFGCIPKTADEKQPRNIYTNALQHIKGKWVLNLDVKNFFHSISEKMVRKTLRNPPFNFNENTVKTLSDLVTHQDRLPIGSPTSPTISNWVMLELDNQLLKLSKKQEWKYTRYIDDMTFSSKHKFSKKSIKKIKALIHSVGFKTNKDKFQLQHISDEPMVTGLVLTPEKPDISKDYIKNLKEDIRIYHWLTENRMHARNIFPAYVLRKFRDSIFGQINFVKTIRGEGHRSYLKLVQNFRPGMFH